MKHEFLDARRRRWVHYRPVLHFWSAHYQHRATCAAVDTLRKTRGEKRTEPPKFPSTSDDQANLKLLGELGNLLFWLSFPVVGACHYPPELLDLPDHFL